MKSQALNATHDFPPSEYYLDVVTDYVLTVDQAGSCLPRLQPC